jgi:hypothetical protein
MRVFWGIVLAAGLGLAACSQGPMTPPGPEAGMVSGGSAGASGSGYCEVPPADPDELDRWNQICMPDR